MFKAEDVKFIVQSQKNIRKLQAQRTKAENAQKDVYIQEDIRQYCESGSLLLDREPPKEQPKIEDLVNDKGMSAITITYKNDLRMNMEEIELKRALKHTISIICFNHIIPIEILLLPDCDEAGNFHYHGVVKIPIKYRPTFKRLITKHIGFMKFDYITKPEGWIEYCKKDIYDETDRKIYSIYLKN